MPREKYQTRLPADTAERVNDYIDNHEVSQSEAIRRLIEAGLEVERDDGEILDTRDMAEAHINERARQSGTILMLLMLGFLTAAEVGLL
jgi:metal-responsive CopG/Arc/MetJ family transcriptional regulator